MTARALLAVSVVLIAIATATAALGASTSKSPKTLVLQKSDLPSGARVTRSVNSPLGFAVTYRYRRGSTLQEITSSAAVLKSRSQAVLAFKQAKSGFEDVLEKITKGTGYNPALRIPRYGDAQLATFHPLDGGKLLVRKNTVVWMILLQTLPAGGREITRVEATAELKRLGPKQQRRVGSG